MNGFDPEVLQDFLTESGELLEELDADLVALEDAPGDPELLNKAFRALHTIKGSGSFLALTNLVSIAHAAEEALNAARRGHIVIDKALMDELLEAVDLLKRQFAELEAGDPLSEPPAALVAALHARGEGGEVEASASQPESPATAPDDASSHPSPDLSDDSPASLAPESRPLALPESKASLLDFMVEDLESTLDSIGERLASLRDGADRSSVGGEIAEIADSLSRTVEFFEFEPMGALVDLLEIAAERVDGLSHELWSQVGPRLDGALEVLRAQAGGLREGRLLSYPVDALCQRVTETMLGHGVDDAWRLPTGADARAALERDGVAGLADFDPQPTPAPETGPTATQEESERRSEAEGDRAGDEESGGAKTGPSGGGAKLEQSIRVEVSRLESLLNLVGELVLQKNRISALARQAAAGDLPEGDLGETMTQTASDLDRVTGDIQVAVMRTRMQALDKLFGKYPRLIRDLARKTGKSMRLVVEGGETEVDRSVIEELGDPLVHLLRNSADHGVEPPEQRRAAGKSETGTIRLTASHVGDHVLVQIIDDGRGLNREKLIAKAIEKGLTTEREAETLTDRDVYRFIFAAGFSTADEVSDLSGRGVGMDVVRTNIEKLKGAIDIDSEPGRSTTISIKIPLTLAILQAMMVEVGDEQYAIPLTNIVEIVRPSEREQGTVSGQSVLRLRDAVLPMVGLGELFDLSEERRQECRFAVVVELNEQRVGLLVSRLIGQQEIVIKPLDEGVTQGSGPVSGATIRDDGGVSLIVDIAEVMERVRESSRMATAEAA